MSRFVSKYRMDFILQNKVEDVKQQDELLWKSIFGLSTKGVEKDTITIKDDYNSGESLGVWSLQGNISPVHANTPDTPEAEQSRLIGT